MKRVFGKVEAVFDIVYLITATVIGLFLLFTKQENSARMLAGIMALVLAGGDAFHLLPRIRVIFTQEEERLRKALGRGKQITSITMTVFYLLLWQIGLLLLTDATNETSYTQFLTNETAGPYVMINDGRQACFIQFISQHINVWSTILYILAVVRMILCLLPQNKWLDRFPPVSWGIWRNIPFFLQGLIVAALFFVYRSNYVGLKMAWLAIILSFMFYLPVVLWANRNPKIGMLMLPKTCAYLWLLIMCLSI